MSAPLSSLLEALGYSFIQRAFIAGTFVALSCAILGVFLVLRRFALIGEGLGHVSFGAIGLCLLLQLHPVYFSIPLVVLASLWILYLSERSKVQGDAAIGLTASLGVATGVLLASIGGGYNIDLFSYLFGNILVISKTEVLLSIVLSLAVVAVVVLLYHDLFVTAFEEEYARVIGAPTRWINIVLVVCTALTVVLGIRVVGIMLVSSLLIFPAIASLQVAASFRSALVIAALFAVFSVWTGIIVSYLWDLPSGATIVFVNFGCFLAASAAGRLLGRR
jgi:zinc transport system permease protein